MITMYKGNNKFWNMQEKLGLFLKKSEYGNYGSMGNCGYIGQGAFNDWKKYITPIPCDLPKWLCNEIMIVMLIMLD